MGRYFEEFVVGEKLVTEKHTMTEDDIMNFAELSGDDNRIHTSSGLFCRRLLFQRGYFFMNGIGFLGFQSKSFNIARAL